jgi:hypothetical protein
MGAGIMMGAVWRGVGVACSSCVFMPKGETGGDGDGALNAGRTV